MIDQDLWQHHALKNRFQSLLLLLVMASFMGVLGWMIWDLRGLVALLLVTLVTTLLNPSISPWLVMRLYSATNLEYASAPGLSLMTAELSRRAKLPNSPKLFYIASPMINAFAVGSPGNAAIALTDGLLRQLQGREVLGVLGHEISHIQHRDLWVMGLADLFSRLTYLLSLLGQLLLLLSLPAIFLGGITVNWMAIVLLILAPNISALAQLALSRTREFNADLNAAHLTGDPRGLASALIKIDYVQGGWLEHVALPGRRVPEPSILRTHPSTQERVDRLMSLDTGSAPWTTELPDNFDFSSRRQTGKSPRWRINGLWF